MAQAVPSITAELFDANEVADLVEAALEGSVAFVPLSSNPGERPAPVDLVAPGIAGPVRLMAQLAGEPAGGMFPVLLSPVDNNHGQQLRAFVYQLRQSIASAAEGGAPGHSSVMPVDDAESEPPERLSSVPAPRSRRRSSLPPDGAPAEGPDPLIGQTIGGGRYRIDFLLGVGGMGRVYNAEHTALAKRIAIKVLDSTYQDDPQFAGRFHQEALAASKLDHRHVMQVIDFGQESSGLLYIAMELLNGENLASKIEREGAFDTKRALKIMSQVLAALQAAHDRDIVHRDMKPENVVMVAKENDDGEKVEHVKVCDFGLAKMADDPSQAPKAPRRAKLTMVGTVMGTPEYMSPEQCRGEVMDLRTDIYACGVILYELLTGRVPFTSENPMDILGMHCLAQPMSPRVLNPSIDPRLEAIILKAMAKERDHRYSSAREMRDALRALNLKGASAIQQSAPAIDGFEATSFAPAPAQPSLEPAPSIDLAGDLPQVDFFANAGAAREPSVAPSFAPAPSAAPPVAPARQQTKLPPPTDASAALLPAAEALLGGDHATREGARLALMSAGTPGAKALLRVREMAPVTAATRPRWVATLREMAEEAVEPIVQALGALDPLSPEMDAALAEDLLRAVPEVRDADLAAAVDRFLLHENTAVRRAAIGARLSIGLPGAEAALSRALGDDDEATRIVAIGGMRKGGLIDRRAVEKLDAILESTQLSGELRAAAAAGLGDADPSARAPAESALLRAIQPRTKSFMGLLRGDSHESTEALVVETVATALLKIGGPAARRAVERRAKQSRGEIKSRLDRLLTTR